VDIKQDIKSHLLRRVVRMIPEGARLASRLEIVLEGLSSRNRTLIDKRWTIGPGRVLLEEAVPVLSKR
jgi:hypothetical protein